MEGVSKGGPKLVYMLQQHVLQVMQQLPECQPGGPGATNKEIDRARLTFALPGWLANVVYPAQPY